jgi:hypothetical protein
MAAEPSESHLDCQGDAVWRRKRNTRTLAFYSSLVGASNSTRKDQPLTVKSRQLFDIGGVMTQLGKDKGRRSYFQRPSSNLAPHTGHSSQLFLRAYGGHEVNL